MRKRKSLTRVEQIDTIQNWMAKNRMNQRQFANWLTGNGIGITPQYLNDVLSSRRLPGPKFIQIFKEITGVTLVAGLIEKDEGNNA